MCGFGVFQLRAEKEKYVLQRIQIEKERDEALRLVSARYELIIAQLVASCALRRVDSGFISFVLHTRMTLFMV